MITNSEADLMSQSKISLIDLSDLRWLKFINTQSSATIFHHPAWMKLLADCYGFKPFLAVIFNDAGNIQAGLPIMDVKSWLTGNRWISLPFSDYCHPLFIDDSAREELTRQLVHIYKENRLDRLEVRWELPKCEGIQKVSEFVLHTIKLDPDPEQIARKFKRTHLQNIHTAEQRGVKVVFGDELNHLKVFYDLQLETRKRHGVPAQPWKYFELLWENIVKAGMGFVLLAQKDNEYIAGMVYLGWGKTLIAKYAASREDRFNLRPNNLLFWEGIRWGCKNGYEIFDMGRTELENTGLRNFKSRWGTEEVPLYYSVISSKPYKPMNGRLESILNFMIKKSPRWVCRLSGELLYRHFG